ncbi:PAS domain-containing hybrid sensor histidine kinase/response regulator [Hymenobacter volaticus]|uniref:histidine kinase n=1 Tax=Hymenobacter volaticus TaxID=2932254 RepID=A0ABY4GDM7_9BACT|nr:PAS domain-containing hybrid sensor histidine kinase/response regulator [Hymenobacter volaticus]UOQ68674.1 PAS domain-containing protein [Hymenobacter volaticus]
MHEAGNTTLNEEFVLADGRVVELDYLVLAQGQAGRLLCYRDVTERHLREAQLRALSYIPEQNPNAIIRLSATGEVIYANPAASPLLQVMAKDEPDGFGVLRSRLLTLVQRVLGTSEQQQQELTVAGQHYLFTAAAVPDEAYATLYLTDVTARQQVEQQLAEQRLFYENTLSQVPMAVAVIDTDFRYMFVNPALEPDPTLRAWMVGKTNEESGAFRERPSAIIARRRQCFNQALREKREVSWEENFYKGGGMASILFQLRPVVEPDGSIRRLIASGIDLTARKQAEEHQRQSEELVREQQQFIRLIVDTLPTVVYVADIDNVVTFRNAAFDALAAQSQHTHAGQKSAEVEEQLQQIRAWRQQVLATDQPLETEIPLTLNSGETCHLQVYMRPLQHSGGHKEVLIVSTDVTALKQAQRQAEENARAKEAFLSRMSHEIRTPLNGVIGMATLLAKTTLTPQQQDYLTTMQQAGQHLLALVNDVLDLAKITTHHLQLAHAAFDVNGVVQGAAQTVAALATQKNLVLQVESVELPSLRVLGDAYRLHQVLLNLLGNALKFTQHGQIQIGAQLLSESPTDVTLRFWVQDTGVGIEPAQQERIFEVFTQATADTDHPFGGTGLGLSISEQLVRYMGGTLHVCSLPNEGTTFSFTLVLPRAEDAKPENQTDNSPSDSFEELRGLRVLLAEDNVVNQWIATVVLEHWGVQIETVDNGVDALTALTTKSYDAALLDIKMPGLTGVEVTKALRQHPDPARAHLPLIALTANAFETDRISYLTAGMDACVNKPFEEADLCQILLTLTKPMADPQQRL